MSRAVAEGLYAYFILLRRWNAKINLTALPLDPPSPATFDRLFVEPLVAAAWLQRPESSWFDLGSGGGSPAVPLKLCKASDPLTMVESRGRKAAFLREVVRELNLRDTRVEAVRFEALFARAELRESATLVTTRAVRSDEAFLQVGRFLLKPGGVLLNLGADTHVTSGFLPGEVRGSWVRDA